MVSLAGITGGRYARGYVWRRARRGQVNHARTVDPVTGGLAEAALCGYVPASGWLSADPTGHGGVCGTCHLLVSEERGG